MPFKNKDPNKGAKIYVPLNKKQNAKVERHKKKFNVSSKSKAVKKIIDKFPEEKDE